MKKSRHSFFRRIEVHHWVLIGVSLLGLVLRLEHAHTFDGPGRGSDYEAHMQGVRWMGENMRSFNFTQLVPWSIGYQPPLWYMLGALILKVTHNERAIAYVAVIGWAIRQVLLSRLLAEAIPKRKWSALAALSIHAVLPIAVLTDGKVNPEGMHTTLFTAAVYFLWRMERESLTAKGISVRTAALFGGLAGLAVLTKATAGVLPLAAVIVWFRQGVTTWRRHGRGAVMVSQVRPALIAGFVWCAVAGWWCGPNVVKYHHPFPHIWDREGPLQHPELASPMLYRRPLGWALPFEWKEYIDLPIIQSTTAPRPNLWAVLVSGTWSDFYDRGFCRLRGGPSVSGLWSGHPVSRRCVDVFRGLLLTGFVLTLAALASLAHVLANHFRTQGRLGSLALPVVVILGVWFSSSFALVYPFDYAAVLNPRYLLPETTLMAACLGMALGQLSTSPWKRGLAHGVVLLAIAVVTALLLGERFGS
jgi:hypothetical protein